MNLRDLKLRLLALVARRRVERDLDDELAFHVEREARKLIDQSVAPDRARAMAQVIAQTARPVAYGLLAGVGLAAALATTLIAIPAAAPLTEIVRVTDPIAYAGSLLVIVGACLLAAWIPFRRAAGLDPMRTLRQE
jgi:hypothetical protein